LVTIDKSILPANVSLRNQLKPGDVGYITYLHGILYANEYGWDYTFEAYVAAPLAEFARAHNDREQIWIVEQDNQISGSVAIVQASLSEAQLRWMLFTPELRGYGLGRYLVEAALDFSKQQGYSTVFLWTVSLLTVATRLYQSVGFRLTEEKTRQIWGAQLTEQRYEWHSNNSLPQELNK
jgi:N-acetylglutamate synthase-like GNAT family acetyltransferase